MPRSSSFAGCRQAKSSGVMSDLADVIQVDEHVSNTVLQNANMGDFEQDVGTPINFIGALVLRMIRYQAANMLLCS